AAADVQLGGQFDLAELAAGRDHAAEDRVPDPLGRLVRHAPPGRPLKHVRMLTFGQSAGQGGGMTRPESGDAAARPGFHLAIPVDDLAAARAFYGGVLGLAEGRSAEAWVDWNF